MTNLRFFIVLILTLSLIPQTVAADSEVALNRDAGRTVKLKLLAFAHDDDGKFIFKQPGNIAALEDGSFFLIDNNQVLKFERDGRFYCIIVRKGQGPGEATHLIQLYIRNSELIVNTGFMGKLMVFDFNGSLKAEYKNRNNLKTTKNSFSVGETTFRILGSDKSLDFLVIPSYQPENVAVNDNWKKYQVMLLSKNNEWIRNLFEIPVKASSFKTPLNRILLAVQPIVSDSNTDYIYFSNTERYEIKKYNLENHKIEGVLRREYKPVMIPKEAGEKFIYGETYMVGIKGKTFIYKAPPLEDFLDIQKLFVVNNRLWVITSTVDKEKGVLVDIFSQKGNYIDNFYLCFPGDSDLYTLYKNPLFINDNHLVIRETDVDVNYMIVIYEIPDIAFSD